MSGRAGTGYIDIRPELVKTFAAEINRDLARVKLHAPEISIDTDKVAADLGRDLNAAASKSKFDLSSMYGKATVGVAGVAALGAGLFDAAQSSIKLNTNIATSKRVFGDAEQSIRDYGRTAATSVGMSESAFRLNANRLGSMIRNLGFTRDEAATTSIALTQVAADLGAAFGTAPEEAIEALGAAMRGERDPIEAYGISLKQADIDARVAAMGLDVSSASAVKNSEAIASLALIQDQAATTSGAFADGVRDGSQATTVAAASFEDAKGRLSKSLVPALKSAADAAAVLFEGLTATSRAMDDAKSLRDKTTSAIKAKDWDAGAEQLARVRAEIVGIDNDLAGSSEWANHDGDYREQLRGLKAELQGVVVDSEAYRAKTMEVAKAKGISFDAAKLLVDAEGKTADVTKATTEATEKGADAYAEIAAAIQGARSKHRDFYNQLNGNLNTDMTLLDVRDKLAATFRENGAAMNWVRGEMDLNTEAGRENMRVLLDVRNAIIDKGDAESIATGSTEAGRKKVMELTEALKDQLLKMGLSKEAIDKIIVGLGLVPSVTKVAVESSGMDTAINKATTLRDLFAEMSPAQQYWSSATSIGGPRTAPPPTIPQSTTRSTPSMDLNSPTMRTSSRTIGARTVNITVPHSRQSAMEIGDRLRRLEREHR